MRFVVDASVCVRWYVENIAHPHADLVLKMSLSHPERIAVPELFSYEVLSVLHRVHREASRIYRNDVNQFLRSGVLRYPMTDHIFEKAGRFIDMGLTGYDACYVALAEELEGSWLTFDSKAFRVLADHGAISEDSGSVPLAMDLNNTIPFRNR